MDRLILIFMAAIQDKNYAVYHKETGDAACFCIHPVTVHLLFTFHVKLSFSYGIVSLQCIKADVNVKL